MTFNIRKILYHGESATDRTHLKQHELVERVVPLHEEDALRVGAAQVLVAVIRVPTHAALAKGKETFSINVAYSDSTSQRNDEMNKIKRPSI